MSSNLAGQHFPSVHFHAPKHAPQNPNRAHGRSRPSVQRLQQPRAEVSERHQRGEVRSFRRRAMAPLAVGARPASVGMHERCGEIAVADAAGQRPSKSSSDLARGAPAAAKQREMPASFW